MDQSLIDVLKALKEMAESTKEEFKRLFVSDEQAEDKATD